MSEQTPKLSLPLIQAAQAQKHVTHNEAIELLDMLTQLTVEAVGTTTPPGSPNEGQTWVVGASATGDWAGHDDDLASWRGGGWLFLTPRNGWRAWSKAVDNFSVYYDGMWRDLPGSGGGTGGSGPVDFNNLTGVGINASFDATNKLAVAADATLFNHAGAGHQLKLNKAGTGDTASLLYQSNWAGRAEMGLAGNDDFSIKVSADGSTFTEALRIDAATGAVTMPTTPPPAAAAAPQLTQMQTRIYLYTDQRWCGQASSTASVNANINLGTGAEPTMDWDAKGVFLPAGSQLHALRMAGNFTNNDVSDMDLRICFQHGPWNNSWNSTGETVCDTLASVNGAGLTEGTAMQSVQFTLSYTAPADGYVLIMARPSTAPGSTRYFNNTTVIEATSPALV